ncbi:hypothetical protein Aazo_1422 ['Nostoc azollae' 0708]|uniref:Uncharacterized protein n=1 Tax=Nostoc azollae (strain 0708) TaxID=551115 RepID=D7E3Y8_NOSA0|nr:hypothetical protein Aazo_1422 ['Nostoc azollae' 0708]
MGLKRVAEKNKSPLTEAIDKIPITSNSPIYNHQANI